MEDVKLSVQRVAEHFPGIYIHTTIVQYILVVCVILVVCLRILLVVSAVPLSMAVLLNTSVYSAAAWPL